MFSGKNIDFGPVYRSIGIQKAERYGVGFMNKAGKTMDMDHWAHPAYVMVLVLRGEGEYMDERGRRFPLATGSCFQRFPGKPHTVKLNPDSHWMECFLEFGESMVGLLKSSTSMSERQPVLDVTITEGLVDRFINLEQHFQRESDIKLLQRLPEILALAQTLHGGTQENREEELETVLEEACDYLTANYQAPVDMPAFCRSHGWGYETIRKAFKERLGASPHQYRIRRRLDTACALLARPDMTVKKLAHLLGYSSSFEFSAQFKRYIGCPPSAYAPRQKAGEVMRG